MALPWMLVTCNADNEELVSFYHAQQLVLPCDCLWQEEKRGLTHCVGACMCMCARQELHHIVERKGGPRAQACGSVMWGGTV